MKRILATIAMLAFPLIGCAQLPVTSHSANLSWTAPVATATWTGCTSAAPCTYAVGRAALTGANCPSTSSTTNYTVIGTASGTTYTDPTAGNWCYEVQTVQGGANSAPSNTATATVTGNPVPPALGNPTVAEVKQALPAPQGPELAYAPSAVTLRVR